MPVFVQVTWVAASMVNENGLKAPPPPAIETLAVATGLQTGCGLGLGEELGLGEGLVLGLGEGLGEGVCAFENVAVTHKAMALRAVIAQRRNACVGAEAERWWLFKVVVIVFPLVPVLRKAQISYHATRVHRSLVTRL